MKSVIIRLADSVIIRKENFGGILFNIDTGDVIEVDRKAFTLISIIKAAEATDINTLLELPVCYKGRNMNRERIENILFTFKTMGLIHAMPKGVLTENYRKIPEEKSLIEFKWPEYKHLSAPETIHWAVTFQCCETCPDCYIERHKKLFTEELDTQESLKLVDKIADSGVFQLAIGGGEPFMRKDLEVIVRRASEKGLAVHITTGNYEIPENRLNALSKYAKVLQIGIRIEELLDKGTNAVEKLKVLVARLNERNIIAGANLIMTRSCIGNFDRIVEILTSIGFGRYTLLRYKPPQNVRRWLQEKPDRYDLEFLEERLTAMSEVHKDIHIRIDCALSFLERRLDPQTALYSGIRGCVAFDRIISVAPDGRSDGEIL